MEKGVHVRRGAHFFLINILPLSRTRAWPMCCLFCSISVPQWVPGGQTDKLKKRLLGRNFTTSSELVLKLRVEGWVCACGGPGGLELRG